jgi:uncharacterized protein
MKVLLVGIVTREMAQSAGAAGYEVISLDYFGDSDQPASAEAFSLVRDFNLEPNLKNLATAAETLAGKVDRVVLGAGLENEPSLFEIGNPENLWSCSIETVQAVRDLRNLSSVFQDTKILIPETIFPGDTLPKNGHWLIKDERHSGGLGVRVWDGISPVHVHERLQKRLTGELMSACFVADGRHARLLGISRQYAGVPQLGAPPFHWCGNVAPYRDALLEKTISHAVECLTEWTGLIGVNGVDLIIHGDQIYFLEVNPRWTGSLELFEHLYGVNMFQLHVDSCQGRLPSEQISIKKNIVWGKGILYAKEEIKLGDTSAWIGRGIADIPHSGEIIPDNAPVCTVFAQARTITDCWKEILNKGKTLQKEIYRKK